MNAPVGPVLALDTSTRWGSVAVGDGSQLLAEVVLGSVAGHSGALVPAADAALRWAGLHPRDLKAIVVAGGPGSFTGLRVAAASAKGMAHALGVPLFAFGSLLVAAAGMAGAGRPVCALFDARRRDVFAACYRFEAGVETMLAPQAVSLDVLRGQLRAVANLIFVGDGAWLHREDLEQLPGASVIPPPVGVSRASSLLWLLEIAPALGRVREPADWEPEYLRASGAERIAAARPG